jgi:hypothetical protein
MEYRDVRELVRIRYELRNLAARGAKEVAAPLLERMCSLASRDAAESAAVQTEVQRWQFVFRLEGAT